MSIHTVTDLNRRLEDQDFTVELTHNGHYRYISPSGEAYLSSSTPSDRRSIANAVSHLEKMGFNKMLVPKVRKRQGRSESRQMDLRIREILQAASTSYVSREHICAMTGHDPVLLSTRMHRLEGKYIEIRRQKAKNGGFAYAWFPTEPFISPDYQHLPAPNGNGHVTLPEPPLAEMPAPEHVEPIAVAPGTPEASLMEVITDWPKGGVVLRDEKGGLWVAVRLVPGSRLT